MDKSSRLSAAALVLGNGVLLLCALVGLAVSFVSLYPLDIPPAALLPQAVIFALISLCAWSLPRYSGRVCLGLAALWGFNLFLNWQKAVQGAMLVTSVCLEFVCSRLGYVPLIHYDLPPAVSQTEVTVTFLTLALALLALLLGGAVALLRSCLTVVLLTLPPLLPAMITSALPHWGGFGALCVCWCALLLSSLCRKGEGRGRLIIAGAAASALLLAGIVILFPSDGYTRPQWAVDTEQAVVEFGDRFLTFLRNWKGPFHRPDAPAQGPSEESVDLSGAGERHYVNQPKLIVRSAVGGHYYLRGSSFDQYTDSSWEVFPDEVWEEYTSALPEGAWTGSPLLFLGAASPYRVYPAVVDNVDHESPSVFLPYQMVEQDWEETGAWPFRDQGFVPAEDAWGFSVFITAYDRDLSALLAWPDTHDGALSPLPGSEARAEEVYRDYVYRHYLDVPFSAREAVEELLTEKPVNGAQLLSDENGRFYLLWPDTGLLMPAARQPDLLAGLIRDLLAERCAYDLETPATPEGEDYVTWFLNESRQGYCMHFATAAALMFRTLGVPARYVSGYTADLIANATSYVPDSAAHAWVEIYVDGWGWYPVEVTPGFSDQFSLDRVTEGGPSQEEEPTLPPEVTEPPRPTPTPAPSRAPAPDASRPPEEPDAPGSPLWSGLLAALSVLGRILAALAAVAAGLWLIQFALKSRRRRRLSRPDTNGAVLDSYRWLSRMRPWGGEIPPEAAALAEKAMYSGRPLTEEERRRAVALYDGQRQLLWMRLYGWRRLTFLWLWGGPEKQKPSSK